MPLLRIIDGFGAGQTFPLDQRITIGRDAPNTVQIADPKSSRVHAEISQTQGRWQVQDLSSSNGTWNEEGRITSLALVHGSIFRIGITYFRFEDGDSAEATASDIPQQWRDPNHLIGLEKEESSQLFQRPKTAAVQDQELARANAYLVLLHQLVLRSNTATTRDQLFEVLDDAAAEILEGDRCAVFLPAPIAEHGGWVLWPAHERRLRARFGAVPFARTLLTAVRKRKEALLCTSDGDINPSLSMAQAGVRSAMAAPLRIGDEVHAALYVDRIAGSVPFTRAELEFLAAVANQLAVQLHNHANVAQLEAEVERLQSDPRVEAPRFLAEPASLRKIEDFIARGAPTQAPVLVLGESGTGKEMVARAIHAASKRHAQPLLVANCATLGEQQVEAMLFGITKGSGGSEENRPGMFELADSATLFLDEIAELPLSAQAKLLQVLEHGTVQRLGDNAAHKVDVRVIAATNRELGEEVKAGRFRSELVHHLDVLSLTLPPLRQFPATVELLIAHFLQENAVRLGQPLRRLAPETHALLIRYHWPGNIRQLKHVIERSCLLAADKIIQPNDLPESIRGADVPMFATPLTSLATIERAHILRVLEHCGGNKKAAAEFLEIDRSTLYAKLRQFGHT